MTSVAITKLFEALLRWTNKAKTYSQLKYCVEHYAVIVEYKAITKAISNSEAKIDILEKRKTRAKAKVLNKYESKLEDQYNQIIKH